MNMLLVSEPIGSFAPESTQTSRGAARRAAAGSRVAPAARGAERRRGLRIRQARPVKIFDPAASRYSGGRTEDVSSTGLRIELPLSASVRPGRLVNVHVGLSEQGDSLANRRQMIPARVVWVTRAPNLSSGTLTAGIEFLPNIAAHLDAA